MSIDENSFGDDAIRKEGRKWMEKEGTGRCWDGRDWGVLGKKEGLSEVNVGLKKVGWEEGGIIRTKGKARGVM